jgi:hypothetical protein
MKPSPTPPVGQHHIERARAGSAAAPFGSLAGSSNSLLAVATEAPPCSDLHSNIVSGTPGSCADSEATAPVSTRDKLAEFNEKNGVSWGVSTLAELEESSRRTGVGFESKSWHPETGRVVGPKKEEGERPEMKARQELQKVIRVSRPRQEEPTDRLQTTHRHFHERRRRIQEGKHLQPVVEGCLLDCTHWLVD